MGLKNINIWLPGYISQSVRNITGTKKYSGPMHIIFCIADHFEPYWNDADDETASNRVDTWVKNYPQVASQFIDADGRHPQHTFFYPEEEYNPEYLDKLASLCKKGFGDVEVHLHHEDDTAQGLREKLLRFKNILYEKHGLLRKDSRTGEIVYGFIHGNWALDNSRRDGRWCGVNNELTILKETGCYADFTLPSAPSDTQTKKINSIYYAKDDPQRPKSHDTGMDVKVDKAPDGDLMIIQGPLTLNWRKRKWGVLPRIENGEISYNNPPTPERVDLWIRQGIHVKGRLEWIFVKVHTHGAQERNKGFLLNGGLSILYSYLGEKYNNGKNYVLHYVTAREMFNIIKAAEAGETGNPDRYMIPK